MEPVQGECQKVGPDSYIYAPNYWAYPDTGAGTTTPKTLWGDQTQWLDLSQIYGNPVRPQLFFNLPFLVSAPWFETDVTTGRLQNWGKFSINKDVGFDIT